MDGKIGYLEGLRGIAALSVVVHHYFCAFYPALIFGSIAAVHLTSLEPALAASPVSAVFNGAFAVSIFFVLSGYVLPHRYFRTQDRENLSSSAMRRYIRLAVPILFTSLIVLVLMSQNFYFNVPAGTVTRSGWLMNQTQFTPGLTDVIEQSLWGSLTLGQGSYNTVLWTMTVEFLGSFLVLSFAALFGNLKNRWVFYLVAGGVFLNTYYLAFIAGMFLCDLTVSDAKGRWRIKNPLISLSLLAAGIFLGSWYLAGWWGTAAGIPRTLLFLDLPQVFRIAGATLTLLAVLNLAPLQTLLGKRIPLFLGKISFSMYLLHAIVLNSFSCLLFLILSGSVSYNVDVLIVCAVSFPLIILLSAGMYRFVDNPCILVSKMVYERYFAVRTGTRR
jgi:peptidoglycan/LPS O-acetylase OafA/YrhL